MSLEQLKAFLAKVRRDSSLQEKLKSVKSPGDVVTIAKEHGHEFTADKLSDLSDKEVERLAGSGPNTGWTPFATSCLDGGCTG